MLVSAWLAMYQQIPQLHAERMYQEYLVALASSQYAGEAGRNLAESWRIFAYESDGGVPRAVPSDRAWANYRMHSAFDAVRAAFGRGIRD